jgi:response regulator RpfG family c-di-GMP phosphodiesterase
MTQPDMEGPQGDGQLLLVIGEEDLSRESVTTTLQMFGYRVRAARTPLEGVSIYSQSPERIEAVVADLASAGEAGVAAVEALGRLDPHVRIVAAVGRDVPAGLAGFPLGRVRLLQSHTVPELLNAVWAALHASPDPRLETARSA